MTTPLVTKRSMRSSIGLTALIDVVFILLMFFMLTSSFNQQQFFEFNAATSAPAVSSSGEVQVLVVLPTGGLVNRNADERNALTNDWLSMHIDPERPLILLPSSSSTVQAVVTAIARLNELGISRVNLGVALSAPQE